MDELDSCLQWTDGTNDREIMKYPPKFFTKEKVHMEQHNKYK